MKIHREAVESRCGAVVLAQTRLFSTPFVWWCLNCPSMTPFPHPAHRTGRADFPHPALGQGSKLAPVTHSAAPDVDRSSPGYPILRALAPSCVALNQGSFPPPALPGFRGTTSPSATPPDPAWLSRASSVGVATLRRGFPCCSGLPSVRAVATTPAE